MKTARLTCIFILLLLLSGCNPDSSYQSQKRESFNKSLENYDWKDSANEMKLSAPDIKQLEKNKVILTNFAYRQIFTPYISTGNPFFITSDSLLNAHHVLYEESFQRMEKVKSGRLAVILKSIWNNLETVDSNIKGDPILIKEAKRRDQIIIGTALRLLGDESIKPRKDIDSVINEEIMKIEEAKVLDKPKLMDASDSSLIAIDYSRYKPRGFYDSSDKSKRYFRAVGWLQSIPFRINNDEELMAILILGNCIVRDKNEKREFLDFSISYQAFIGEPDDLSLSDLTEMGQNMDLGRKAIEKIREDLEKTIKKKNLSIINDQVSENINTGIRILPSYRLPDTILIEQLMESNIEPSSLHIAAMLGSNYAQSLVLKGKDKTKIGEILTSQPHFSKNSLYCEYLDCLRYLVKEPEKEAPEFMKDKPWKVKSCNTVLSGWVQERHALTLQVKPNYSLTCKSMMPPGFVEPNPKFFAGMAALSKRTGEMLERAGAFQVESDTEIADELREMAAVFEKIRDPKNGIGDPDLSGLSRNEIMIMNKYYEELAFQGLGFGGNQQETVFFRDMAKKLKITADELESGKKITYPIIISVFRKSKRDLKSLWKELEAVSLMLESISKKQLRKEEFSYKDIEFLENYGETIAGIMLYGGNSFYIPHDDSPRIIDVLYLTEERKYLEAGTCRPRALLVLYPYKGKEILCKGAILPFYEFQSKERLNDNEWKNLLDSDKRPPIPQWMKPVLGSEGIKKPKMGDK